MFKFGKNLAVLAVAIVSTLSLASAAHAGRACVDNFSENGERNTGKGFKSYIEVDGDLNKVFQAIGRAIAAEGFAGINAVKDLGVVSAYQDTHGKHSPLNATISESRPGRVRVEIIFQLAPGLSAPASGVKDGLCKILETVLSDEQRAATAGQSGIALRNPNGDAAMSMVIGSVRQSGVFPVLKIYSDIDGARSAVRTHEHRPVLIVREPEDPSKKYVLVSLKADDSGGRRALKMMSGAKLLKTAFTGKVDYAPDADWTFAFTAKQQESGVWQLAPTADLEPGEYGLWDLQGMALASFGIDN